MSFDVYLAALAAEAVKSTSVELSEGQKDGHAMAFRFSNLTPEDGTVPTVSGVWICDVTGRAFGATHPTTEENAVEKLLPGLERYLERLACH